ncbi:hypothetical protein [Roseibacillus ishigakijimensis]|uniref:Uncharacterized protein n=1 Tax=Roseibacillus ishigakijimensis TaxID=454146 RepID=A0A934RVC5_9BACT|nr:hypothetical protein [Roseibacillus ishigakijimensis]MBK1835146.1 hypothetical protein [Roseibacillus ishigakijimensis]
MIAEKEILEEMPTREWKQFDRDMFRRLHSLSPEGPCLTLWMPMESKGAETRKNPIVFKNALADARESLSHDELNHERIGTVLSGLAPLGQGQTPYWQEQSQGLLLIAHGGGAEAYKVPFTPTPLVVKDGKPHLSPLLQTTVGNEVFVLVVDLNQLRGYHVTRWGAQEVSLSGMPTSLEEAMKFDDPEKSLQYHATAAPARGGTEVTYHGHGVTTESTKQKKIQRFYEMVQEGLPKNLPHAEMKVVLCADRATAGHFREVVNWENLSPDVIDENVSNLRDPELVAKLCSWMEEQDRRQRLEHYARFRELLALGQGSQDFADIVFAARMGKVETLFVREGAQRFGRLSESDGRVEVHAERHPGDYELVNQAACETALAEGAVHFISAHDVASPLPEGEAIGAIYRY